MVSIGNRPLRALTKALLNNRPLTAVGTDDIITPNNILTGRDDTDNDMLEVVETERLLREAMIAKDMVPKLFEETEKRREVFWDRFRNQYLESIKFETKPTQDKPGLMPEVGDIVIVFDKTHKLFWSKGMVLELIRSSSDGLIRKAKVRINNIETIKAINHLYPLEARAEEAIERYQKTKGINTFEFEGFEQDEQVKNQERIKNLKKAMATSVQEEGNDTNA